MNLFSPRLPLHSQVPPLSRTLHAAMNAGKTSAAVRSVAGQRRLPALILIRVLVLLMLPGTALAQIPVPSILKQTIPAPPTGVQANARLGSAVATDGAYVVAGAPLDDQGGLDFGVVKVFSAITGALLHTLPNPSQHSFDRFGSAVAMSGTLVVVGAYDDATGGTSAGRAYVYDLASGTPTVPVHTLSNPGAQPAMDSFGFAVGISGTRVVVGASMDDTDASNAGIAYAYDLAGGTPTVPTHVLHNPSAAADDYFGTALGISGTRVVVTANGDDTGASNSGSAYVYDLGGVTPTVPAFTLTNPVPAVNGYFGRSAAISDTRVVVGAPGADAGVSDAGSAYVYDLVGGTPTVPMATLNNPAPGFGNEDFGASVAISGTRVVVGADEDDTGFTDAGIAYVYDMSAGTPAVPIHTLNNPTPDYSDWFGSAVAVNNGRVVVSAILDETSGTNAGSAYVYELGGGTPTTPVLTLSHNAGTANGQEAFGGALAMSGTWLVAGAAQDDMGATDAGSAYVFNLANGTPTVPVVTLNNPTPAETDNFGHAVAISGSRVVVGAPNDNTGATDAGSVYVYDLNGATPSVPLHTLNNPSPAATDTFGYAVAISGTRVVVGAFRDDTGFTSAGIAYVYDLSSGAPAVPVFTLNNPTPAAGDQFGLSVGISGTRVVVGANGNAVGSIVAGSVHVFDLGGGTPAVPVHTLNNPSPGTNDSFGWTVAISGTRVVVGAPLDDLGTALNMGSAYVYDLSTGTPTVPVATLNNPAPNGSTEEWFGRAVAISGRRVVIGAHLDDAGAVQDAGIAYVYHLEGATPTVPVATLGNPSPGPATEDWFGHAVAIEGTTVAVGTPNEDVPLQNKGAIYLHGANLPELAVEESPSDLLVTDGESKSYGTEFVGSSHARTFVIRNTGDAPLADLSLTKDGAHAGDFILDGPLSTTVPYGGSTTFTVGFAPTVSGARTASVHLASNVGGSANPFDIGVTGTGIATDARLSALVLSAGTLAPAFSAATLDYTALVLQPSITVTPTRMEAHATIQVRMNGGGFASVASGSASGSLPLNVGDNTLEVKVTAEDGTTTKSYTVIITRPVLPSAATQTADGVGNAGAVLHGLVNANGFSSTVAFEYGLTTAYGQSITAQESPVAGALNTPVRAVLSGLAANTTYHYRVVATNAAGTVQGNDGQFTTLFLPPTVTTGSAVALTTTSVGVSGTVRANDAPSQVFFDYGTTQGSYTHSVAAFPATVSGHEDTPVTGTLPNLLQGTTYYYRVRAISDGGTTAGSAQSFQLSTLSGLQQQFPPAPPQAGGTLIVYLTPNDVLHGWRFVGEQQWRASGDAASGLTTSDRDIEFRPVPGYNPPPQERVEVVSGDTKEVEFDYYDATTEGDGSLTLTLKPDSITTGTGRAQWRFLGEDNTRWRDSGTTADDLSPGAYLIECKPVTGRVTPTNATVVINASRDSLATLTYFLAGSTTGTPPAVLTYGAVTTDTTKPYAYVGQIRSDAGVGTGFVVKPRAVATAAHVVWNESTLSAAQGVQWLFQRHRGVYEPEPVMPHGFYMFASYSGQRQTENTPGFFSPQSQHLDVAALYFTQDGARGGYGGFLASDLADNEFLLSNANKMLVGYPVDGIATNSQGRMHATPVMNIGFKAEFGKTFSTTDIRSSGGNSGGPLCVQFENGSYYPAAICLGGSGQMVVRAIDSAATELFGWAQISGAGGGGIVGGGSTHTTVTPIDAGGRGAIKIILEPAAARAASAFWRLNPSLIARASGYQVNNLTPGGYVASLAPVDGYVPPGNQNIPIEPNTLTTVTYTYQAALTPQESWRQLHFGTASNTGDAADNADPDHDGYNNLAEYTADTLPTSALDYLRSQNPTRGPGTFSLSTPGKTGRTYLLERSTTLQTGSWGIVATQSPLSVDGTVTLTDTSSPAGAAFYRIRVTGP
ncbi:MAG: choice-of-anchor D domain-containing protein [Prosthecobacter sp.]